MNTQITTDVKAIEETYTKEVNSSEGLIKLDTDDFRSAAKRYPPFVLASAEGDLPISELASAAMDIINSTSPRRLRSAIISVFYKDETCIRLEEVFDLKVYLDSVISDTEEYKWGISNDSSLKPGTKRVSVYAFGKE